MHSYASLYLGGEQIPGQILNLSATGVALKCPVKRELGKTVQVEFYLGRSVGWIRVEAKLVRYEHLSLGFLWGLKFVNLSDWVQAYLEGFVKDQLVISNAG
jgi:hypothetical protein